MYSDSISQLERSGDSEQCAVQIHIYGLAGICDTSTLHFDEHVKWYAGAATRNDVLLAHVV